MKSTLTNTCMIECNLQTLFDYVTQPWNWHEWHPNSLSAIKNTDRLKAGDQFEEDILLRPLDPLPLKIKRHSVYDVLESTPYKKWVVEGTMPNGIIRIIYEFEMIGEQKTYFKRTLIFNTKGSYLLLHPVLYRYLKKTSKIAVNNLKRHCEHYFTNN